ncbi:MAG TPA: 6-hydroxymethylpterin diphosphokinase MptE-like protein [Kofleriaceae bacterium]|nr:6-hydroxymethylpterin diphosphokinase MptE-like protein [Kofleriaceae bacterium]
MSLELLDTWRSLLADVGALGTALCRAIEAGDVLAGVATMMELRRTRSALARVEAPVRLEANPAVVAALEDVTHMLVDARAAESAMASWLGRKVPGDAMLLRSPLGAAVLADMMLPEVWDFELDAVVLVGSGLEPVAEILRDLGQRRIVIHGGGAPIGAIATVSNDEVVTAVRTMIPVAPSRFVVRGALGVDRDEVDAIKELVRSSLSDMRIHRNTVQVFSRTWIDQAALNLPAIAKWPSVAGLDGAFANRPMVIVAPGPSLAKNIDQLRGLDGRAVLACFSHSLKPVVAAGLVPDVVITVDPQDVRYHFDGCDVSQMTLVNAATSHPSLYELPAKRFITMSANSAIDDWIFDGVGENACLPGGGSVATSAFSLALRWGCDPIVFVGLDLSFPGGEYYVKTSVDGHVSASTDDNGHLKVQGWSSGFHAMKAQGGPSAPLERTIKLPGWHGGEVPSSFMFSMFHRWFVEKMREVAPTGISVYNCTEGGAMIPGMDHRPLAELLATFDEVVPVDDILDAAVDRIGYMRNAQLAGHIRTFRRGLKSIRYHAVRARRMARTGGAEAKLQKTERSLASALQPFPFVSLLAQHEIENAHSVALHQATSDRYLAASANLFDKLVGVLDVLEPLLAAASVKLDGVRSDHEAA